MQKIVSIIFIAFLLTACGFHLRGYEPISPQLKTVYLETKDPYDSFVKELKHVLTAAGVQVVSQPQPNVVRLEIINTKFNHQIDNIGSTGQNTIYLLTYSITYQIRNAQGVAVQTPQTISTFRNYSAGTNQLLGDTYVEHNLHEDMQRDVIYQLLNRLQRYK